MKTSWGYAYWPLSLLSQYSRTYSVHAPDWARQPAEICNTFGPKSLNVTKEQYKPRESSSSIASWLRCWSDFQGSWFHIRSQQLFVCRPLLAVIYLTVLRQPQRRFAMDAILGQYLAFDLARNLAAIFAFDLARNAIFAFHLADSEIMVILWYFDLSLNYDQLHKWSFCFQA